MAGRVMVRVAKDAAALAEEVARSIRDLSVVTPAPVCLALAGGRTPERLYARLAEPPYRDSVSWDRMELFFGDERGVPLEHEDSNFAMVQRALLSRVSAVAHPMPAASGDAAAYETLVCARVPRRRHGVPIFDLVLLGVGDDGHTASLFPGGDAIGERSRLVVMSEDPRHAPRMTFTYPLINAARRVWILAAGEEKGAIVRECLGTHRPQGASERYPVLGVRPEDGELIWWLDEQAAALRRTL